VLLPEISILMSELEMARWVVVFVLLGDQGNMKTDWSSLVEISCISAMKGVMGWMLVGDPQ
jgi:hypothetical protein